jgi:pilus assembly protein CpaF
MACTFLADCPREATRRLATVMGANTGGRLYEANQMICDAIDLLVQISIRHEVRRVTAISNVAKDLKNGDMVFEPICRYMEESLEKEPGCENLVMRD